MRWPTFRHSDKLRDSLEQVGFDSDGVPETPAPMAWAMQALPTMVFGTPEPNSQGLSMGTNESNEIQPLQDPRPSENQDDKCVNAQSSQFNAIEGQPCTPLKEFQRPNDPVSILRSPGGKSARKSVSFNPRTTLVSGLDRFDTESLADLENEQFTGMEKRASIYMKSGLPADFPGKFPSPFVPRIWNDEGSLDQNDRHGGLEKCEEQQKVTDILQACNRRLETAIEGPESSSAKQSAAFDADVTVDMMDPRSASGRFWKTQRDNLKDTAEGALDEKQVLLNVAREREEYVFQLQIALDGEKQRNNEIEKTVKKMSDQIRLLQEKLASSATFQLPMSSEELETNLRNALEDLAESRRVNEKWKNLIDVTEQEIQQLRSENQSLKAFNHPDDEDSPEGETEKKMLKKELRLAKKELKDYHLVKLEADSLRKGYTALKEENSSLQRRNCQFLMEFEKANEENPSCNRNWSSRAESLLNLKLQESQRQLEDCKKELEHSRQNIEKEISTKYETVIDELRQEITREKNTAFKRLEDLEKTVGQVEDLKYDIAKLQNQCDDKDATISENKIQLQASQSEIQRLSNQIELFSTEISLLKAQEKKKEKIRTSPNKAGSITPVSKRGRAKPNDEWVLSNIRNPSSEPGARRRSASQSKHLDSPHSKGATVKNTDSLRDKERAKKLHTKEDNKLDNKLARREAARKRLDGLREGHDRE